MTHPDETTYRRIDLNELFANLDIDPHDEWLHHKRDDAAIVLTSMLWKAGMSRAELAKKLDWKPSRVTRALSGKENLTINTLAEIINAAGYDFDIRLRRRDEERAIQPWEQPVSTDSDLELISILLKQTKTMHAEAAAMKQTWEDHTRAMFRYNRHRQEPNNILMETVCANDDSPLLMLA